MTFTFVVIGITTLTNTNNNPQLMRKAFFLALISMGAFFTSVQAQSFGYVNSQAILADMEEVKAAESDLVGFREQKKKLLQLEIEGFQQELAELEAKNQAGELTPKQIEQEQARMQQEQQRIAKMENDINEEIAERRETKFQPVFDKVNAAIEKVAKEKSYQYVFDSGAGGIILYADESMDITEAVKAELSAMN
jgi:outer membrane protein